MMTRGVHIPVLFRETLDLLAVKVGGKYVDGTLGRAGHTSEILSRGGEVLGIDRDDQALKEVAMMVEEDSSRFAKLTIIKGRHGELATIAREHGWKEVDGVLLDLGVSSPQLDEANRGFSFMRSGPLDMRMDQSRGETAADLIATLSAEDLSRLFREYGEENQAWRIAKAIVANREKEKFETTGDLADFIEKVVGRKGGHHPATRVFQALRMAVNREVEELESALEEGLKLLAPGGRFAVITFESITDRIVKKKFAAHVGKMISLQQGGSRWEGEMPKVRSLTRHAVVASDEEKNLNPRSRSAKLRVVEKEKEVCI